MTTCLEKSCSFGLPRVPFVNCCQFMYLVISLLVLESRIRDPIVTVSDHCLSSSRKLLRIKVTPILHLTYSKTGGNLGLVLKMKNIACLSIF